MIVKNFMSSRGTLKPSLNSRSHLILNMMIMQSPVLPLKKAAGILFPSTYESLVWAFRCLVSYATLGTAGSYIPYVDCS